MLAIEGAETVPSANKNWPFAITFPVALILPLTVNFSFGVDVPIPTLPFNSVFVVVLLPKTTLLSPIPCPFLPITIWLEPLDDDGFELSPIQILEFPVSIKLPALCPIPRLEFPVVLSLRAPVPYAVLESPSMLFKRAWYPVAVL